MPNVEEVKSGSRALRGGLSGELGDGTAAFSEESCHLLKFHGIYQQDDRDVRRERTRSGQDLEHIFMVRASVPGGAVSASQWSAMDRLAGEVADGSLRLTSRGGVQFHFTRKGGLAPLIRTLDSHLVTTLAACGDVVRNIVACPAPLSDSRQKVLLDLAQRLAARFRPTTGAYYEVWIDSDRAVSAEPEPSASRSADVDPLYGTTYLPRKFKIGLAWPGDNCTDIFSHDLGLVPVAGADGADGFAVLVGGGLGASHARPDDTFPRLADPLGWVPADAVEDVAEAVVLAFRDLGNRDDRKRARLKYVIEELGLEAFRAEVEQRLGRPLAPAPDLPPWHQHDHLGWHRQDDGRWFLGVPVPSGRVTGSLRTALAEVVEQHELDVRITPRQDLLLTGIETAQRQAVVDVLRRHEVALADDLTPVRRLAMACPALPTCGQALAEAERVAPEVLDVLEAELAGRGLDGLDLHVRMTGCPNGCARPYTAEIGLVGRTKTGYDLHLGGAPGGTRLAAAVARSVKLADLPGVLGPWLDRFADERRGGESFGDFVHPRAGGIVSLALDDLPAPVALARPRRRTEAPGSTPLTDAELHGLAHRLEGAPADEVVRWAVARFGPRLTLAASMGDAVLIDVASRVAPGIEVIFLDTQYHFQETLATTERIRDRYPIRLRVVWPEARPDDLWRTDPDACCRARKVLPMERALQGRTAWLSGVRRADSPVRQHLSVVQRDRRGLVKVNPLIGWSDEDVADYIAEHDVPVNPLVEQGYASIGCWPCTRPVRDDEDARAGRWDGSAKTECGLHL